MFEGVDFEGVVGFIFSDTRLDVSSYTVIASAVPKVFIPGSTVSRIQEYAIANAVVGFCFAMKSVDVKGCYKKIKTQLDDSVSLIGARLALEEWELKNKPWRVEREWLLSMKYERQENGLSFRVSSDRPCYVRCGCELLVFVGR